MTLAPFLLILAALPAGAEPPLSVDEAVRLALESNPQVRSARAQYEAALHQIDQAYAPQDPQLTLQNGQSPRGISHPAVKTVGVSEAFQFPGKAWLQGDQARRTAEIARLASLAQERDVRAQVKSAYYQALLDRGLAQAAAQSAANLSRVVEVARVAYAANQVTQSDLISAQFDLAQASQTARSSLVAAANDEAALNQLLGRLPRAPLTLAGDLSLEPLKTPPETMEERALASRQELLETIETETNAKTARALARLEFLPDLNVALSQNRYQTASAAPAPDVVRDNTASISFNLPVFFWFKQKEDVRAADAALEAARGGRRTAELQTRTAVTQLERSTRLAYETAVLYRDTLVPLALEDFQVALIAYQSRKLDFSALSGAFQRVDNARVSFLTAADQYLAGKVALEQAVGSPMNP